MNTNKVPQYTVYTSISATGNWTAPKDGLLVCLVIPNNANVKIKVNELEDDYLIFHQASTSWGDGSSSCYPMKAGQRLYVENISGNSYVRFYSYQ